MEAYSLPSPRSSKPYSDALSSPVSHFYSSSSDYFYSAPSSPANTPVASSDTDSCTDEFEFKTCPFSMNSLHYSEHQPPVMAFADELFHDNQLLPLKLPPRLQCPSPPPPPPPPPKPQGSILKLGLSALCSKNKEFDPFMAAVKRIRKEDMPLSRRPCHRRTWSCEPIGTGETDGGKWYSHGGRKKPMEGGIISIFRGAPKGKGGVKGKVSDRSVGVRELKDGLMARNGDCFNAKMVDVEVMRNKSLKRYKQSRGVPKLLACFMLGPR